MQAQTSHKNIGLMLMIFACAVLLFAGINTRAQAPWNRGGNNGYYGNGGYGRVSSNDLRKAYDKGYRKGYNEGKHDARDNRGSYRNGGYGNYGNNGGYGGYGNNRRGGGELQRAYSDGFNRGYQEGYDRNRRNNRNSRYGRYGNRSIFGIPLPY
jgi:hypothetical protein